MKRWVLFFIFLAVPAWAQGTAGRKAAAVDNCAPIGRTADGQLVYAMKCANLPAPVAPLPQARVSEPAAAEPEVERSGIFGLSYRRKPSSE